MSGLADRAIVVLAAVLAGCLDVPPADERSDAAAAGDGGAADGPLPDGPLLDAPAPGPATCEALYGDIGGYVDCGATDDRCRFAADTSTSTCATLCAMVEGQMCLDVEQNGDVPGGARPCTVTGAGACDDPSASNICVCTRI